MKDRKLKFLPNPVTSAPAVPPFPMSFFSRLCSCAAVSLFMMVKPFIHKKM